MIKVPKIEKRNIDYFNQVFIKSSENGTKAKEKNGKIDTKE